MGIFDFLKKKNTTVPDQKQDNVADQVSVNIPHVSELPSEQSSEVKESNIVGLNRMIPTPIVKYSDFSWSDSQLNILRMICEWQLANNRSLVSIDEIRGVFPSYEQEIKSCWPSINMLFVDLSRFMFASAEQDHASL